MTAPVRDCQNKQASPFSREDVVDDATVHIGQAEVPAAVAVGEAFVVESH